jgi:hypothetical protein
MTNISEMLLIISSIKFKFERKCRRKLDLMKKSHLYNRRV